VDAADHRRGHPQKLAFTSSPLVVLEKNGFDIIENSVSEYAPIPNAAAIHWTVGCKPKRVSSPATTSAMSGRTTTVRGIG
jgi:hypothetical protein